MKVVLRKDVPGLGNAGELREVRAGYARNYLLPRAFAYAATPANEKRLAGERAAAATLQEAEAERLKGVAEKLGTVSCTIQVLVGENDKLYGSVTGADVADELARQGYEVDRRTIEFESVRDLGIYTASVKLGETTEAKVKVWVVRKKEE